MREMQYSKHRTAKTWHELGLMGDTLSYTDEEILTSQALGYVKHTVGKANPMDIAVLYSIVDMGEGVEVTAKDLVNDYTRLASLFESGIIVRGKLNTTHVPCSGVHFERKTTDYANQRHLWHADSIVRELDEKEIDYRDYLDVICGWEVDGYYAESSEAQLLRVEEFKKFCSNVEDVAEHWFDNIYRGAEKFNCRYGNVNWYGLCEKDVSHYCPRHTHGTPMKNAWVMYPDLSVLDDTNIPIGYTSDSLDLHYVKEGVIEYKKMLARTYIKHADDKTVLRQINKAVNRMFKRDVLLQTTWGRGRKFKWYDSVWRKVQDKRTRIMASNSKKRKLGDEVNGWVYSKGRIEKSFGMEIVSYVWKPIEELYTYDIRGYSVKFLNEQDAIDYCSAVNNVMRPNNPQACVYRTIKNGELLFDTPTISYNSNNITNEFRLKPDVEVESMPTPQQCLANIQTKGDKWIEMNVDKFKSKPLRYNTDKLNITKEVSA
jgi:hypothetical protein